MLKNCIIYNNIIYCYLLALFIIKEGLYEIKKKMFSIFDDKTINYY